ncbi:tetratricopeptide repeat protein [Luteibacter sp. 9135]|uniref:tetratricopeptide repeat protein n=1 Tax=Luteibacter sp. 9135 TaxID=1500893 RepID=UPI00163AFA4A|nr:tetratricopeptide repeat protein [Luteibacter sp. 9135]
MTNVTLRVSLLAGLMALAGCAAHGTLPESPQGADVAQREREAHLAYAHGDMQRAADLYEALVRDTPDDADAWFHLGNARFRLQRQDDAVLAYDRAIQISPGDARALYNLGVVRLKQAQAAMLDSAQAGKPGDPLRGDGLRIAQRLAKVGDDLGSHGKADGGAPPFIVEAANDASAP